MADEIFDELQKTLDGVLCFSARAWLYGVYISEVGDFGAVDKVSQTKSRPVLGFYAIDSTRFVLQHV